MLAHSHFMLGLIQLNAEDSKEYNIPVSQRGIMLQSLKQHVKHNSATLQFT